MNEERLSIEHSTFKSCVDLDALYYHPKVGRLSSEVYETAQEAAQHMGRFLDTFKANNVFKKKPFLDQFNFKVENPKHPDFSLVKEEYMEDYLTLLVHLFKKYLYGYGMWGWRDWRDDKIFNGAFQFQKKGWIGEFSVDSNDIGAILNKNDSITQTINILQNSKLSIEYILLEGSCVVVILDGEKEYTLSLEKDGVCIYDYVSEKIDTVFIQVKKGSLKIKNIACYSHMFSNGMLNIEGNDTKSSLLIKEFNSKLKI